MGIRKLEFTMPCIWEPKKHGLLDDEGTFDLFMILDHCRKCELCKASLLGLVRMIEADLTGELSKILEDEKEEGSQEIDCPQ